MLRVVNRGLTATRKSAPYAMSERTTSCGLKCDTLKCDTRYWSSQAGKNYSLASTRTETKMRPVRGLGVRFLSVDRPDFAHRFQVLPTPHDEPLRRVA